MTFTIMLVVVCVVAFIARNVLAKNKKESALASTDLGATGSAEHSDGNSSGTEI